jgi:hypothetical protein
MDTRTSKDEEFVITNDVPSGLIIFSCSSDQRFIIIQSGNLAGTMLAKLCNGIVSSVSFGLSRHRWLCRTLVVN